MAELRLPRIRPAVLGFSLGTLLAAGLGGSGVISSSMEQLGETAALARDQAAAADAVLLALQKAESGERGYLLTERPTYLAPYRDGVAAVGPQLTRLEQLASGTTWLQADAAELRAVTDRKLDELRRTLELVQTEGRDAAMAYVLTDAGQTEMESARAIAGRIAARAGTEQEATSAALRRRQSMLGIASGVGVVLGTLVLGIAGWSLTRNRAALLRARSAADLESARLQAAIEHLRDGVAVFDAAGTLTLQNARFAPLLGLAPERVPPGTRLADLAATVEMDPPVLAAAQPGERSSVAEVRQGKRALEIWRSAMPQGGQIVTVADISRRVDAEAIARQAQKMEIIGQMTGGIAHDFNNLLQIISANIELALDQLAPFDAERSVLDRLEAASAGVARGARLTRHLLAFARRQQLTPETIDPARLLLSLEDTLRRTLGESVELKLVIGAGLWTMRADPTQMESALLNLALNARDAMTGPDGRPVGQVVIEVANVVLRAGEARPHEEITPGDYVVFALSDTGSGMTDEQLRQALEPFYTTKPEGMGTGLGLPMVFGFAQQSGGHLQLVSAPGRGTTARIYIPRTELAAAPAAPPHARAGQSRGELVLLVEDDPAVRRVAAAAIASLGYVVHEAGNADQALALLDEGLQPAVLFTDVVMPGVTDARELARRAQALLPGLAVLFTTGHAAAIDLGGPREPGVHLLNKPWRTAELGQALREALRATRAPAGGPVRRRVLLVEDEGLVRMTTADVLTEAGFEVVEAESGAAALSRLDPPPDLLISDLGLPDMNGLDLIAQVRARVPNVAVVVASGRSETPDMDAVYLTKPFDGRDLRAAAEAALNQRTLVV